MSGKGHYELEVSKHLSDQKYVPNVKVLYTHISLCVRVEYYLIIFY